MSGGGDVGGDSSAETRRDSRLAATVVLVSLVVAVVGSLGAPLITAVAREYDVSLSAAQWTLTGPLLSGAVATPLLGRLGSGPHRRMVVLAGLAAGVAGSVLTVVPLPFAVLLAGRVAQGLGLGLTALMMATARDQLDERRAAGTIATVSVASTAGIGVGYPVAGLLTDLAGIRAAYALGLAFSVAALIAAAAVLPAAPPRPAHRIDGRGALLLSISLLGLLFAVGQVDLWQEQPAVAGAVLGGSLGLLAGWAWLESRTTRPLVDVRLLRQPAVAGANLVMLAAGVGMYLLLSLITRDVQAPAGAAHGFGLDTFEAGLVLVPFSVLGFAAGRLLPANRARPSARARLAGASALVLAGFVLFALARDQLAGPVIAMSLLGIGVGTFSAAMPAVILAVTPQAETASAMSVNQVVRGVGFSIGSALGGLVLAAYTSRGFPRPAGYTTAAWVGTGVMVVAVVLALLVLPVPGRLPRRARRRPRCPAAGPS